MARRDTARWLTTLVLCAAVLATFRVADAARSSVGFRDGGLHQPRGGIGIDNGEQQTDDDECLHWKFARSVARMIRGPFAVSSSIVQANIDYRAPCVF